MKSYYDNNTECRVYVCPHCNYTYHEYFDYDKQSNNNEERFIQMCEALLFETSDGRVNRLSQYSCPSCGILQIDISDI